MIPRDAIERLLAREHLRESEMVAVMGAIMDGAWAPEQLAAFLTALRMKGESQDELLGAVRVLRDRAASVVVQAEILLDTCGTGGDGASTFNISTGVALVAAAAGVTVAKHGNRSVSSRSGSADVLEALGVRIDRGPEVVRRCIEQVGVGFLFAPSHHGAMRHAAPVRRALGFRTLFNLVGPLTNPAGATHQLVGLYDPARLQDVALVLLRLGSRRALVVHGTDGLDELTLAGETLAVEVRDGQTRSLVIRPEDVGLERAPTSALAGGGPEHNAVMLRALLEGGGDRPCRDVLALNAAAALYVAEAVPSLEQGVVRAQATLATGAAARVLDELVRVTNEEEA